MEQTILNKLTKVKSTDAMNQKIIPHQFRNKNFGFVKLLPTSKKAFEKNWPNCPYSLADIQQWFNQGNMPVKDGAGLSASIIKSMEYVDFSFYGIRNNQVKTICNFLSDSNIETLTICDPDPDSDYKLYTEYNENGCIA